jgi:hypothetical protein
MPEDTKEEISLSVEETNALRARLGLAPLKIRKTDPSELPLAPRQDPSGTKPDQEKEQGKRLVEALSRLDEQPDSSSDPASFDDWLSEHRKRLKPTSNDQLNPADSESQSESDSDSSSSDNSSRSSEF